MLRNARSGCVAQLQPTTPLVRPPAAAGLLAGSGASGSYCLERTVCVGEELA